MKENEDGMCNEEGRQGRGQGRQEGRLLLNRSRILREEGLRSGEWPPRNPRPLDRDTESRR